MPLSIGRIVHYRLNASDAAAINKRRADSPLTNVGNQVSAGQFCPAVVVAHFGGERANLQVFLDGNDTYWATSAPEGDADGHWCWPPRV